MTTPPNRILSPNRICPQCKQLTEASICPDDGYNTVEAARYAGPDEAYVGRTFDDRYAIKALIGLGGMGTVYRARQLSMDRNVALKILRPQFASNLEQVRRFQTEARAASALDHPNTIRVIDFGQSQSGDLYLVTELLEGEPLSELLEREGRIQPARAVDIVCQILKSLSEAHAQGIIHRDLKPENIFLKRVHGEEDFVKVLDFGIAKVAGGMEDKRITTTGTVVGTPLYMSPEQARGEQVSRASDIYAVGAVLYELLAGHPPFNGDSPMAIMMAHVQSPVRPLEFDDPRRALAALSHVVGRCLEKAPRLRPSNADVLREELEDLLWELEEADLPIRPSPREAALNIETIGGTTSGLMPVPPRPRADSGMSALVAEMAGVSGMRRRRWLVGVVAALAVGGLVVWMALRQPDGDVEPAASTVAVRAAPSLPASPGAALAPSGTAAPAAAREAEAEAGLARRPLASVVVWVVAPRRLGGRRHRASGKGPELRVRKR